MTHLYLLSGELCKIIEAYLLEDGTTYCYILLQNNRKILTSEKNLVEIDKLTPEQKLQYL